MYYPCQPWDSSLGIATSLLHRLQISSEEDNQDPYGVLDTLPMKPGAHLDLDQYRRRLIAHLLDEEDKRGEKENDLLIILDDVHNLASDGNYLFGALLQVAESTNMRLLLISRTNLAFYDRRDVHTRGRVVELRLTGLSSGRSSRMDCFNQPTIRSPGRRNSQGHWRPSPRCRTSGTIRPDATR